MAPTLDVTLLKRIIPTPTPHPLRIPSPGHVTSSPSISESVSRSERGSTWTIANKKISVKVIFPPRNINKLYVLVQMNALKKNIKKFKQEVSFFLNIRFPYFTAYWAMHGHHTIYVHEQPYQMYSLYKPPCTSTWALSSVSLPHLLWALHHNSKGSPYL